LKEYIFLEYKYTSQLNPRTRNTKIQLEIFDKFAGRARNKQETRKEKLYLHTPTLGRTFQQRSPINLHHSTVLHKPAQCRSGAH
jgi:hypothetical protein